MTLRDEIAREILDKTYLTDFGIVWDEGVTKFVDDMRIDDQSANTAADAIIVLLRERLTSNVAVRAAVKLTEAPDAEHDAEVMGLTVAELRAGEWKRAKDAITAALDAVLVPDRRSHVLDEHDNDDDL